MEACTNSGSCVLIDRVIYFSRVLTLRQFCNDFIYVFSQACGVDLCMSVDPPRWFRLKYVNNYSMD